MLCNDVFNIALTYGKILSDVFLPKTVYSVLSTMNIIAGFIRVREMSGKFKFFQGQLSGNFMLCQGKMNIF